MDIAALLAETNKEAANDESYDVDEFENEEPEDTHAHGVDKVAVLRAASAQVALEEKKIADRIFNTVADEMRDDIKSKKNVDRDDFAILADASREVNEKFNKIDTVENAEKYRTVPDKIKKEAKEELIEEKEPESEDDRDEGEDDEEDENNDRELNQSLIFAIHNERPEAVKTALKSGAYYFARDRHGWTPLHWAASKGNENIMEILIEFVQKEGKNVKRYINSQDSISGWTPMHVACVACKVGAVEVLLRYKARKRKLNFVKEKPSECIGKSHIRDLKTLLGVPINRPPVPVEETKDFDEEKKQDREEHDSRDTHYGGIPSGRRPVPPSNNDRGNVYDRYNNYSDDSAEKTNFGRSHARDEK